MALLLSGSSLGAQRASTVPASSDIYRRLEAVTAFFPVRAHLGVRPATVAALTAVLDSLDLAIGRARPGPRREWATVESGRLRAALGGQRDSSRSWRAAWEVGAVASNAIAAKIDSNGQGTLDAVEHPFERQRQGVPIARGLTMKVKPLLTYAGNDVAIIVEPRAWLSANDEQVSAAGDVGRTFARAEWRNVGVQVGADELRWGQSPHGSLFLSGHAASFPAISVSSNTPFVLPWWFGLAGPMTATLFVADLGPRQNPPHARLAGWHLSLQPWTRFELGVSVLVQTGGNGGPPATFLERVVDLFPAIDALAPQHADLSISNKFAGGNLRLRIPELSGLDVYYELALDDFDGRRLRSSFVDDAGHLLGARIASGPLVWRAEAHRTSIRLYEHTQFPSGLTYRRTLLGNPLGPNGKAFILGAEWDRPAGASARFTLADERRDPSQFGIVISGDRDQVFRFVRLTDDPHVRRIRFVAELDRPLGVMGSTVQLGYNRAWRESGEVRHEWMAGLSLRSRFLPGY